MSKSIVLILFVLIWNNFTFAQNYIPYYEITQKAESAILGSNYKKAVKLYRKAYKKYAKTFKNDDLNALHCALLQKDYESAVYFQKRLLQKNWDSTKLFKEELENYIKSKPYQKNKEQLAQLRVEYFKKEASPAIALLNNMLARDQAVRQNIKYDSSGKSIEVLTMDSLLCLEMIDLMNKYGFPHDSEHKEKYIHATVIFTHDAHWRGVLVPHLKEQGLKGNFHLRNYMYYSDMQKVWSKRDSTIGFRNMFDIADYCVLGNFLSYNGKLWQRRLTPSELNEVNKNRKVLGFCTIQEEQEKFFFAKKLDHFIFGGIGVDNLGRNIPLRTAKKLDDFLKNYYEQVSPDKLTKKFKQKYDIDDTNQ
jgi:hypothetical protein